MAWSDNFNRADGPLGAAWTTIVGSPSISGNKVVASTESVAVVAGASVPGNQSATITVTGNFGNYYTAGIVLKSDGTAQGCYTGNIRNYGFGWQAQIYKGTISGNANIANVAGPGTLVDPYSFTLEYVSGTLNLRVNGSVIATANDSDHSAHTGLGIVVYGTGQTLDDFNTSSWTSQTLTITPDPLWVGGGLIQLTATGVGTAWDPGNPADTTFSADHGTITAQAINSATTATLFYTPADYFGTITFSETKYGLQDTVTATVIPPEGQGNTACPFNAGFIADANAAGSAHPNSLVVTEASLIHATEAPELNVDIIQAIAEIWAGMYHFGGIHGGQTAIDYLQGLVTLISGEVTPTVQLYTPARATSIREELEGVTNRLKTLITPTEYTLENVIASVKGLDNRSVTQVYDLVDALPPDQSAAILTWLNTYLGTTGPTLNQLGTMISDLATIAGYTLGDVLDAIAAIPGTDLTPVMNKLNTIQPNASHTLTTITDTLTDLHSDLNVVRVDVDDIRGPSNYTLGSVMTRLDDIMTAISGIGDERLPLWPGLAGVTLGTELPLADDLSVPGPLHGLLFTITASAPRAQSYLFGTVASWARVGQVLFVTDRGDYERSQTFGIDRQVLTPVTMERAASALIRLNANWEGTVRPWTRT